MCVRTELLSSFILARVHVSLSADFRKASSSLGWKWKFWILCIRLSFSPRTCELCSQEILHVTGNLKEYLLNNEMIWRILCFQYLKSKSIWVLLTINYDLDKIQKYKRLNSQKISQEIWWAIPRFAGSQEKNDTLGLKLYWVVVIIAGWCCITNFRALGPLLLVELEFLWGVGGWCKVIIMSNPTQCWG